MSLLLSSLIHSEADWSQAGAERAQGIPGSASPAESGLLFPLRTSKVPGTVLIGQAQVT